MYYYAMIDSSNIVTNTISSASTITAPTMIPITEEQFNSGDLIGKYYDSSTGEFVDPTPSVLAELSTEQINHGEEWLSDLIESIKTVKRPKPVTELTKVGTLGFYAESMASGNDIHVIISTDGKIYTSTDLLTWTLREQSFSAGYNLCFGNGVFLCEAEIDGVQKLVKSTDGINWTVGAALPTNYVVRSIAYGDGIFAIGASNETEGTSQDAGAFYITSDNGTTITQKHDKYVYAICYDYIEKMFVGLTYYISSTSTIDYLFYAIPSRNFYSRIKGANYDSSEQAPDSTAYGKGLFVGSNPGDFMTMTIHGKWKYTGSQTLGGHTHSMTFGEGAFFAADRYYIYNSPDGIVWHYAPIPDDGYASVIHPTDGKLVVIDNDKNIYVDDCVEYVSISDAVSGM